MTGRIVIVSGPPGAGKSTVARRLAEGSGAARAVHLHTDDFYAYIRKGFVAPWEPAAQDQNTVVMTALAQAAATYAAGGYEVVVDGIVGAWFLEPWRTVAEQGLDLRYVVLMPEEAETVARATSRIGHPMTDADVVRTMWGHFDAAGSAPDHRLDTTRQSADQTAAAILTGLEAGRFRLA